MNDRVDQGSLELEVSNFGPIVEAKIDLRPLTVFVGPSNTGKSYLAILIYALHRYFGSGHWSRRHRFPAENQIFRRDAKLPRKTISSMIALAKQISEDKRKPLSDQGIILSESVVEVIRSGLGEQGDYIGKEIGRCFGIKEVGDLIRKGTKGAAQKGAAQIVFRTHNENKLVPIDHRLTINTHASEFKAIIPEGIQLRIGIEDEDYTVGYLHHVAMEMISPSDRGEEWTNFSACGLLDALTDHVRPQIVGPLDLPAFYLPADRTGVMHAHNVVVSALIGSAAMTGLRPAARTPMLSGVLADFLEQLIELGRSSYERRKTRHDLGTPIEKAILGGSVEVDKPEAIDYPHFSYRPEGWKESLSLMNVSSMVSELAPVVLYLRHIVGPRNVLIVEEPESHLHPAMQVEFTRQLAALVHAGIRVIVTTHSEWVLEELANIVRRSTFSTSDREKTADAKIALRPDQVGAWLFQPKGRPKGSVVKEIRLDDSGLFSSGFDDVAAELHNDWADLANRIGDSE